MTREGSNFIREISEAYLALEREPMLKDQLHQYEHRHRADGETIARLEKRIMELKEDHSTLNAKLRSVEAERDEASFRELEASDKANSAVSLLQNIRQEANDAIVAITGSVKTDMVFATPQERSEWDHYKAVKKAEAEAAEAARIATIEQAKADAEAKARAEAEALVNPAPIAQWDTQPHPTPEQVQEVPATDPTPASQTTGVSFGVSSIETLGQSDPNPTGAEATQSIAETSIGAPVTGSDEGQSESPPIAPQVDSSLPVSSATVEIERSVASSGSGKYAGLKYADWPYYVSLPAWIAGGGTEEDYNFRY